MTSVATVTETPTTAARGRLAAAVAGIAFAPIFVLGFIMAVAGPDNSDSDAKWLSWYADKGHRTTILIGAYLLIVAALFFLAFVAGLHDRVAAARLTDPVAYRLLAWTGLLAGGLMIVAAIQLAGVAGNLSFGDTPMPSADLLRQNIGFPFIGVAGALSAAAFIALGAGLARRTGVFPGWLTVVSYVAAALLVGGVLFLPLVALPLWMLIAGIALTRRPAVTP